MIIRELLSWEEIQLLNNLRSGDGSVLEEADGKPTLATGGKELKKTDPPSES